MCYFVTVLLINRGGRNDSMNYNKLWKLLIDRGMIKKDLQKIAGISSNAIAKMGKGGDVSTHILSKICRALNCNIDDIVELVEIANLKE